MNSWLIMHFIFSDHCIILKLHGFFFGGVGGFWQIHESDLISKFKVHIFPPIGLQIWGQKTSLLL